MSVTAARLDEIRCKILEKEETATLMAGFPMVVLKGKPFSLNDHFFFKPFYRTNLPRRVIVKCARQVGKTQNIAVSRLLNSASRPFFNTLFVCPRFEQVKRLSTNYIKPLIQQSPVRHQLIDLSVNRDQSVLQRTFRSGSIHHYSFAFLDAERIRGLSVSEIVADEAQDILWDHIPVIAQCLAGSPKYKYQLYSGTPKTMDNTIQKLWEDSSMGEWSIRCEACNYWNIAAAAYDLLKMIGKTGVVCAKCGRAIQPRDGGWVFPFAERQFTFVGYHVPQVVHPYHYAYPDNWQELLLNQRQYPTSKFYNECLGESYDSSEKLITLTDLRKISCLPHRNELTQSIYNRAEYSFVVMGVDWTGGGPESESWTSVTLAGVRPGEDVIHIIYTAKISRAAPPDQETRLIMDLTAKFRPNLVAHDYTGAGNLRELMMTQAGMPAEILIPFTYSVTANKSVIYLNSPKNKATVAQRLSYTIDKPRSLITLCTMMRAGKVLFPQWPDEQSPNPILDFLNLCQVVQERPHGSDVYLIDKTPSTSDDTCHSVNFACSAIWYCHQQYPDISQAMSIMMSQADVDAVSPVRPEW